MISLEFAYVQSRRDHVRIEGFHVTSYQANFASPHTHNRHVGFLLAWHGIGKYNTMFRYFLFSSYNNSKF